MPFAPKGRRRFRLLPKPAKIRAVQKGMTIHMHVLYSEFKRKFSVSMYKNLRCKLGEMTFTKDFVNDTRGDLYPVIQKSENCMETVAENLYTLTGGEVKRLFCQFFPYATYALTARITEGKVGFSFHLPTCTADLAICKDKLVYSCENRVQEVDLPAFVKEDFTVVVSCRPKAFDVYFKQNGSPQFLCTFQEDAFQNSNEYATFSNGYVALSAVGSVTVSKVLSYIDNGISMADMRPIKYEDGEVLLEQGKVYFSASVRMQEGAFQGMFSWVPGTAEFDLTGAVFYDCGDGIWRNYVAPVILYHREKKQWYVWVSSFEHEHILAYAAFEGDPRFGVNVVDVQFMKKASDAEDVTAFAGFFGDEDPDFFYDREADRWLMAICRLQPATKKYSYVFFASKEPFTGYTYIGRGADGAETGGSFVKCDGEQFFVCGNDFRKTSEYRIYSKNGMQTARFNYPDGGFRGWGTVMPIKMGSRTRYFWLTFDRHRGSAYTWSYGNVYCFEAYI